MLKHRFWEICPNPKALFKKEGNTIETFMFRANKQFDANTAIASVGISSLPYQPSVGGVDKSRFIGDAFEAVIEALLIFNATDNRIGIEDYCPIEEAQVPDMGVDGIGIHQGKPCVVQIKYQSDTSSFLGYQNNLGNFGNQGTLLFSEYPRNEIDFVVITNCNGVNHKIAQYAFDNKLRIFNGKDLGRFIDNNASFWNKLKSEVLHGRSKVTQ